MERKKIEKKPISSQHFWKGIKKKKLKRKKKLTFSYGFTRRK